MKRLLAAFLILSILLGGCASNAGPRQYSVTYLDLFDTVTTVIGITENKEEFDRAAGEIYAQLQSYHRLFDIYHSYEGISNLKTVNDRAGVAPVTVDRPIIELLLRCKEFYDLTDGKVNAAMGSVLSLWHRARSAGLEDPKNARLPSAQALEAAAGHTDIENIIIDEEASTVYLADPEMSLDVGAIAKGWACQQAAQRAPEGMLISLGGNVCVTGPKDAEGTPWIVGIQHPDSADRYLKTLRATGGAVVTSGDYQRTFTVAGKAYHHIIDPETRMPGGSFRSVTVVCGDSALADALSTALFLLPLEQGMALAEKAGAQALWLDAAGNIHMTPGFSSLLNG